MLHKSPGSHNFVLLARVPDPAEREWYVRQVVAPGWSRSIPAFQIDARAHARRGNALTSVKVALPPADSDLAGQVFKDRYLHDVLGTADPRREREVEQALEDRIERSLGPTLVPLMRITVHRREALLPAAACPDHPRSDSTTGHTGSR